MRRLFPQSLNVKGSALAYGLVIMTMITIVLTSIVGFVASQTKLSLNNQSREQALHIAETGINFYQWYLAHETSGFTVTQIDAFWSTPGVYGLSVPYTSVYNDSLGHPIGEYTITIEAPKKGSTVVKVRSVGFTYKNPDAKRTIDVRFRRPSWSEYAFLSNEFNRFWDDTDVFGKVHANLGVRFDGVAHNLVTSSVASVNDPNHNGGNEFGVHTHANQPPASGVSAGFQSGEAPPASIASRPDVFAGGRQFPVASVDFSGILGDLNHMKIVAQAGENGSLYFDNAKVGRHIVLKNNGTFDIRTVDNRNNVTNDILSYYQGWSTYTIPQDGVIFVENNAWVDGTINNKHVTIVAADLSLGSLKNVYIRNDIRYTNYNCDDVLGIIGQNDIEITGGSEQDLRIDGALLAQNGRVGREHYLLPFTQKRDVITVYGAIASKQRYRFAWGLNFGYQVEHLYYDNNLLYCPPPYFPVGTEYKMDSWEES
ncbi:MAG: PilX N-terminal domain-containing pilus assembly protein [Minisyncoccota bacterium]